MPEIEEYGMRFVPTVDTVIDVLELTETRTGEQGQFLARATLRALENHAIVGVNLLECEPLAAFLNGFLRTLRESETEDVLNRVRVGGMDDKTDRLIGDILRRIADEENQR